MLTIQLVRNGDNFLGDCFILLSIISGLYINQNRDDVPEQFRGIGIRIEDDILVTDSEPVVLTVACPKHPDNIEEIMENR